MLEAIANEAHLQILAALEGQSEACFRAALQDRADGIESGVYGCQTGHLDWSSDDIRAEVASTIRSEMNAYHPA